MAKTQISQKSTTLNFLRDLWPLHTGHTLLHDPELQELSVHHRLHHLGHPVSSTEWVSLIFVFLKFGPLCVPRGLLFVLPLLCTVVVCSAGLDTRPKIKSWLCISERHLPCVKMSLAMKMRLENACKGVGTAHASVSSVPGPAAGLSGTHPVEPLEDGSQPLPFVNV